MDNSKIDINKIKGIFPEEEYKIKYAKSYGDSVDESEVRVIKTFTLNNGESKSTDITIKCDTLGYSSYGDIYYHLSASTELYDSLRKSKKYKKFDSLLKDLKNNIDYVAETGKQWWNNYNKVRDNHNLNTEIIKSKFTELKMIGFDIDLDLIEDNMYKENHNWNENVYVSVSSKDELIFRFGDYGSNWLSSNDMNEYMDLKNQMGKLSNDFKQVRRN